MIRLQTDADACFDNSKKKSNVRLLFFVAIICIVMFVLAFTVPKISLIISAIVFVIFLIIFYADRCFGSRLATYVKRLSEQSQVGESDDDKNDTKERNANTFAVLFSIGILLFMYIEWRRKALMLSIPVIVTPLIVIYTTRLGQNTVWFLHIVSIYLFFRLYVYIAMNLSKENSNTEKYLASLKIILETIRIVFLFIGILGNDLGFEVPKSLLNSIVATIAIDSIMNEIVKLSSPKKEVTAHDA